jgi:hypothetical protein
MAEAKTWTGGCHCGLVRYEVETSLDGLVTCNCSICQKRGSILAFVPESSFRLISGEDAQTDYQFNKKTIHHLFCKTCGVSSFATGRKPDGTATVAVNVRCLDGLDAHTLNPTPFDGKSL